MVGCYIWYFVTDIHFPVVYIDYNQTHQRLGMLHSCSVTTNIQSIHKDEYFVLTQPCNNTYTVLFMQLKYAPESHMVECSKESFIHPEFKS